MNVYLSAIGASLHPRVDFKISPSFLPTFTNASTARSICAALIYVRMRAWPCGATGRMYSLEGPRIFACRA